MKEATKSIQERKQVILEMMKHPQYVPMKIKEMMMMLQIPASDRMELEDILGELISEGKIIRTKRGKFAIPQTYNLVAGTFQGHPKGFGFLILDEEGERDIFIPASGVNGALHKDRVMCRITRPETAEKRAEAEVIEILRRGPESLVGTYQESQNFGFVVPDDQKYARDIFIPKKFSKGAVTGHKVLVKITDWAEERRNPEGKIISVLGHINDPGVDILSIIYQYDLPREFPDEVMNEVEAVPSEVDEKDKKGRRDLRDLQMVTIDGEDAKDLDDAISIEKLPNGHYRLGVHIADVTHYVKEKSPLDLEAYERGTSIYLVDRVIPMLPHKLSNGICSLNAHVDRLALTCMMDIDKNGNVQSHEIMETLINIDERMSYTNVKKILLDEDEALKDRYKDFIPMFKTMEELAEILRKKRFKRGAIDFDFPETKVILDNEGVPIEMKPYDRNVATRIIEEFMLVCNETIAEDYFWQEKPFVYRSHEDPDPEKILALTEFINNFGYHIKGNAAKIHPKDMQKVIEEIEGKPEESIINHLLLRSMKQARYTAECNGHFGLAARYYCHFTSPIRRYPDLQIHRIIKANLHHELKGKREAKLGERMPEVAKQCSLRERRAEEAERETIKLKKVEFMEQFIGKMFEGAITGTTSWGCYVELPNTVEGLVHVNEMADDYYIYDEPGHRFIGERTKQIYRLGDKVFVQVLKTDSMTRTIDFRFVTEEEFYKEQGSLVTLKDE
ncbi:MAG: ribonuclease R [Candidatus Cellulosilyticum pullistercoris]|uniref:Ribonuclease R n=1 Tax=Candidatus Cellulosilyticum pullistercoris TaxID=2838521 RepID=A0A9E2KBY1_9FIRM|nr:ribonuclease R [Candidatus Cellulosilyticum pullistercoris]